MHTGAVPGAARASTRKSPVRSDQPGLSYDRVVAAALDLVDEQGLAAFSVREVARRLSVSTATVYWHVGGSNDLLASIVARVVAQAVPVGVSAWDGMLRALAAGLRQALHAHPHVAPLFGGDLVCNRSVPLDAVEAILASLQRGGVPSDAVVDVYNASVGTFIGFLTVELATPAAPGEQAAFTETVRSHLEEVDAVRHPVLAQHRTRWENHAFGLRWGNGAEQPLDDAYDLLVEVILAGLAQRFGLRRS
jgi:AcrR family transcriptional regulator